jgi:hypothetical protein
MPVPDEVIFGPAPGGQYRYGDVRGLDEAAQFAAIRERVGALFNSQVSELGIQGEGKKKVYSPFPLFLLGCVGVETLGRLFFGRTLKEGENRQDMQRECFVNACAKLHQKFGRALPKDQKEGFDGLWGDNAHDDIGSVSVLLYKLGRHTMVHGYQSRGVFLTEGIEDMEMNSGALVLNPYWFWFVYLRAYDKLWYDFTVLKEENDPRLKSMRIYRDELLN